MSEYHYLIIGGGMTADAAVRGIRKLDPHGPIGLISAEYIPPYNRPLLTKDLWKGKPIERIWCHTKSQGVDLHLGRIVHSIDPEKKHVTDNLGQVYTFKKLLLATGGKPRRLPFGGDQIIYFRTFGDYERLRWLTKQGNRFAVIGGGFIGSEIAAALTMNGKDVTMIFPEDVIGARTFPHDLGLSLNQYFSENGVEIRARQSVIGLDSGDKETFVLKTADGPPLVVDGVVAGIGIQPNVDLAEIAGLRTDDGILVDEFLRTNHTDIYAAGDVASFYNPVLRKRMRVEHEDNAKTMGDFAGRNMAGDSMAYRHQPFFYSDLFDLGYEAVGDLDPQLETVADWKEPYREGVVYYMKDERVRGVLLWNVWGEVNAARELIAAEEPIRAQDLKGRLPMAAQHQPG